MPSPRENIYIYNNHIAWPISTLSKSNQYLSTCVCVFVCVCLVHGMGFLLYVCVLCLVMGRCCFRFGSGSSLSHALLDISSVARQLIYPCPLSPPSFWWPGYALSLTSYGAAVLDLTLGLCKVLLELVDSSRLIELQRTARNRFLDVATAGIFPDAAVAGVFSSSLPIDHLFPSPSLSSPQLCTSCLFEGVVYPGYF